ncbi:MAG: hypothetical protein ACREX3_01200 [Gammaproteobacteria bacterium]
MRPLVSPVISSVELGRLSRLHLAAIPARPPTASVAAHLRRCPSAMVGAGLDREPLWRARMQAAADSRDLDASTPSSAVLNEPPARSIPSLSRGREELV